MKKFAYFALVAERDNILLLVSLELPTPIMRSIFKTPN